ncbi:methyltransferase domain-containing protein [uncultured Propionivibrio sp.]|uniref:methyltransferase domain-containing protein n=1 Tax=uncultured Propionivibrio sp. TaxID=426737 RepID=UPI0029C06476|nr:methyltransferase domain-containing protein [uncultured Propionivibrio sp.]
MDVIVLQQLLRRAHDSRFARHWFVGDGIDIRRVGEAPAMFGDLFPLLRSVRAWQAVDGDPVRMDGVAADTYDFVHSNHCLEYLDDPALALRHWIRICKPGGHLVLSVRAARDGGPPAATGERGASPKWACTPLGRGVAAGRSLSVAGLVETFVSDVELIRLEKLPPGVPGVDGQDGASVIEFVLRKRLPTATLHREPSGPVDIGERFPEVARQQQVSDLFAWAVSEHVAGRAREAAGAYANIIGADPRHLGALNNLSLLLDFATAEKLLQQALSVDPTYFDALLNLGSRLLGEGRHDDAVNCLRRAHQSAPADVRPVLLLCKVFEAGARYREQASLIDGLPEMRQCSAQDCVELAKHCVAADRLEAAQRFLDLALVRAPDGVQDIPVAVDQVRSALRNANGRAS